MTTMRIKRVAAALVVALGVCVLVAGCGGTKGQGPTSGETASQGASGQTASGSSFDKPFEGMQARDASELDEFVKEATTLAKERKKAVGSDAEEGELTASVAKDFKSANASYRAGDYAEAREGYEGVLDTYPLHLGANNNLTLALLRLDKSEEALTQALACAYLFRDDAGTLVNTQVAATACGFSTDDLGDALEDLFDTTDVNDITGPIQKSDMRAYWEYNNVWNLVETQLYGAAHADAPATTADAGEVEEQDGRGRYLELKAMLDDAEEELTGDTDVPALQAYLELVGLQLGYVVDPEVVEPAKSLPYVVADDEACTVRLTQVIGSRGRYSLVLTLQKNENDASSCTLAGAEGTWSINGIEASVSGDIECVRGDAVTDEIFLEMEDADAVASLEDVETIRGILVLTDNSDEELGRYALSYAQSKE